MVDPSSSRTSNIAIKTALDAVLAILPLSFAVIPWGILTGALAIRVGLSPLQAQCLSLLVFAGAAQLSAITLISGGAQPSSIFGSTLVISARHLLYSIVFRKHTEQLSGPLRLVVAFLLTDEMFVVSEAHTKKTGQFSVSFAVISGFTFYVVWNLATYVGIVFGQQFENLDALGLDFAIVATFIAMSFEQIRGRPELVTVLVAGISAILLKPLFTESYIILATIIGMTCGNSLSEDSSTKETSGLLEEGNEI